MENTTKSTVGSLLTSGIALSAGKKIISKIGLSGVAGIAAVAGVGYLAYRHFSKGENSVATNTKK